MLNLVYEYKDSQAKVHLPHGMGPPKRRAHSWWRFYVAPVVFYRAKEIITANNETMLGHWLFAWVSRRTRMVYGQIRIGEK